MQEEQQTRPFSEQENTLSQLKTEREQIARRNAFHSSMSSLFREMENSKELVPLLDRIAQEVITLLGADSTYMSVVHESKDFIEVVATSGVNPAPIGFRHVRGEGIAGSAWERGEIQVVDDYYKYSSKMNGFGHIKQVCAIPIKVNGKVEVVVGVVYETINVEFQERVVEFEEFAQQATIVVENAKLIKNAREELSRKAALYRLSDALYSSNDIQTVLDVACCVGVDVCGARHVHIYETDIDGNLNLTSTEKAHQDSEVANVVDATPLTEKDDAFKQHLVSHLVSQCLESEQPVYISRSDSEFENHPNLEQLRYKYNVGSIVCIPLVHDDISWGVLVAQRDRSRADFTRADITLLSAIGNQTSVAQHQQKLQAKIEFQAYHDSLTGLPNRLQFEEKLIAAVANANLNQSRVAVLFIDLDGFKFVNDVFGHLVGDTLLQSLSARLKYVFTHDDLLARMGGDEFAVLLEDVDSLEEALEVSESVIAILSAEYVVEGVTVNVGASLGISLYPDDSDSAGNLLKNADIAMYQAKSQGKNRVQYFNDSLAKQFKKRAAIEKELAKAISNNELRLAYQPKVSVSGQCVLGVEALLRWEHSTWGNISPVEFIPIAEESGLILPIGDWVLHEACRQLSMWHEMGFNDLTVAVNVSVQQFSSSNFVDAVKSAFQSAGIDPCYLNLEITESLMLVEVDRTVEKLLSLKELGLSLSIDDFGTGFSSLRYLQDLPLDFLKIDRSFIQRLDDSKPQLSLVNTIIGMAETFSLETVAEGVETPEQLSKVVDLGCDCIQGYLFSKPVAPEALAETIAYIEGHFSSYKQVA